MPGFCVHGLTCEQARDFWLEPGRVICAEGTNAMHTIENCSAAPPLKTSLPSNAITPRWYAWIAQESGKSIGRPNRGAPSTISR
jgi:hypothetical protein